MIGGYHARNSRAVKAYRQEHTGWDVLLSNDHTLKPQRRLASPTLQHHLMQLAYIHHCVLHDLQSFKSSRRHLTEALGKIPVGCNGLWFYLAKYLEKVIMKYFAKDLASCYSMQCNSGQAGEVSTSHKIGTSINIHDWLITLGYDNNFDLANLLPCMGCKLLGD